MKAIILGLAGMAAIAATGLGSAPAIAQSAGYVIAFDSEGRDSIGWGPAFRPDSSFYEPGTPLTPGEIAGRAYRARTGHGVYDRVESPAFDPPVYQAPRAYYGRSGYPGPRIYHHRRVARAPYLTHRRVVGHPRSAY
ncbi:hypothetical protein SAMN05519104_2416 [Rhizobiales bacterium GAS188]|nr:hypothetical protein SAMN05519104_2416 [Rhizobiales bacterium GAS188]